MGNEIFAALEVLSCVKLTLGWGGISVLLNDRALARECHLCRISFARHSSREDPCVWRGETEQLRFPQSAVNLDSQRYGAEQMYINHQNEAKWTASQNVISDRRRHHQIFSV